MQELDAHNPHDAENASKESNSGHESRNREKSERRDRNLEKEIEELRSKVREAEEEAKDLKDKYLRAVADLHNYRKRVRKDIQAAYDSSNERFICDILPVIDNLERALEPSNFHDARGFRDGVRMIYDMLTAVLEDEGVKQFCSIGEQFDPARHEAVYAVESGEHPPETVVDEIERGYMIKERLLRPARVTVSKGNPDKASGRDDRTEADEESEKENQ